jgi:hypothetical protein
VALIQEKVRQRYAKVALNCNSNCCCMSVLSILLLGITIALFFYWQYQQNFACTNKQIVFYDRFDRRGLIREAHSMSESSDPNWWVGSGAYVYLNNGTASTIQGILAKDDPFRVAYASSNNSADTDFGFRPQNIFRIVNRNIWSGDYTEELYFNYLKYNNVTTAHKNLGATDGVSLMINYQDEDNLYYVGLRADGFSEIKKKIGGNYSINENPVQVFPGVYKPYDNLIPQDRWTGLRALVEHKQDKFGKDLIYIAMYVDKKGDGSWMYVTSFLDQDRIFKEGHTGIRTDFMDVQFKDFQVNTRNNSCV